MSLKKDEVKKTVVLRGVPSDTSFSYIEEIITLQFLPLISEDFGRRRIVDHVHDIRISPTVVTLVVSFLLFEAFLKRKDTGPPLIMNGYRFPVLVASVPSDISKKEIISFLRVRPLAYKKIPKTDATVDHILFIRDDPTRLGMCARNPHVEVNGGKWVLKPIKFPSKRFEIVIDCGMSEEVVKKEGVKEIVVQVIMEKIGVLLNHLDDFEKDLAEKMKFRRVEFYCFPNPFSNSSVFMFVKSKGMKDALVKECFQKFMGNQVLFNYEEEMQGKIGKLLMTGKFRREDRIIAAKEMYNTKFKLEDEKRKKIGENKRKLLAEKKRKEDEEKRKLAMEKVKKEMEIKKKEAETRQKLLQEAQEVQSELAIKTLELNAMKRKQSNMRKLPVETTKKKEPEIQHSTIPKAQLIQKKLFIQTPKEKGLTGLSPERGSTPSAVGKTGGKVAVLTEEEKLFKADLFALLKDSLKILGSVSAVSNKKVMQVVSYSVVHYMLFDGLFKRHFRTSIDKLIEFVNFVEKKTEEEANKQRVVMKKVKSLLVFVQLQTMEIVERGYYSIANDKKIPLPSKDGRKCYLFGNKEKYPRSKFPSVKETKVYYSSDDIVVCALKLQDQGFRPVVVCTGNSSQAGGSWALGGYNIEENLVRRSDLFFYLNKKEFYPIPEMGGIYCKDVSFFRNKENSNFRALNKPRLVDILTIGEISTKIDRKTLMKIGEKYKLMPAVQKYISLKIENAMHIAIQMGNDAFIIDDYCVRLGVPPDEIVNICYNLIDAKFTGCFKVVVFSVVGYLVHRTNPDLYLNRFGDQKNPKTFVVDDNRWKKKLKYERGERGGRKRKGRGKNRGRSRGGRSRGGYRGRSSLRGRGGYRGRGYRGRSPRGRGSLRGARGFSRGGRGRGKF